MKKLLVPAMVLAVALFAVLISLNRAGGNDLAGQWQATWNADPKAYPNTPEGAVFTMQGTFTFTNEGTVHIEGYGKPGCVFYADTMRHSAQWQLQGDSLHIKTANDPYGIYYTITEKSSNSLKMSLIEDITITLTK